MRDPQSLTRAVRGRARALRVATIEETLRYGHERLADLRLLPAIAGASPAIPQSAGGQQAVQTLTVTGTPTGGTVTFGHPAAGGGASAPAVAFNAPSAPGPGVAGGDVQSALRAIPGLQNVNVTGPAGGPWVVTFPAQQSNIGNQLITVAANGLTGGSSPNVAIALIQTGQAGGDQVSGSGADSTEFAHIVGAAGQPAYATGWSSPAGVSTALTVPAAAARTDFEPAQFYIDSDGEVHLEGVAVWGIAAAPLIFTLPTGPSAAFDYAPAQSEVNQNDIEVRPDGTVNYMGSTASAGAVQLNAQWRAKGV